MNIIEIIKDKLNFKRKYHKIQENKNIDINSYLKSLGFNPNEEYDVPETIEEANELSIKAHIEEIKRKNKF